MSICIFFLQVFTCLCMTFCNVYWRCVLALIFITCHDNDRRIAHNVWNGQLLSIHTYIHTCGLSTKDLKRVYHLDNCCRACRETPNGKLYSTESSLNKISARFKVWKMSEWSHLLDLFTFPSPLSCWLLPHCFHIAADLSFSHASEWTLDWCVTTEKNRYRAPLKAQNLI